MEITQDQLRSCIGNNPRLEEWCNALNQVLPEYNIDTPQRVAAFVAQCAHESANFKTLRENLNYRAESLMRTWPKRFPTMEMANQYARQPEKIANKVYANRMGNGLEESGDGWRYSGRGLIQLTGKSNYSEFAKSIDMDLNEVPAYLETPEGAVKSACWFWKNNGLNELADKKDIVTMTKRINGGTIGLDDRKKHFDQALKVFGA